MPGDRAAARLVLDDAAPLAHVRPDVVEAAGVGRPARLDQLEVVGLGAAVVADAQRHANQAVRAVHDQRVVAAQAVHVDLLEDGHLGREGRDGGVQVDVEDRRVGRVADQADHVVLAGKVRVPVDLEHPAGGQQGGAGVGDRPGPPPVRAGEEQVVGDIVVQVLGQGVGDPGPELGPDGVRPVLGVERAEHPAQAADQDDIVPGRRGRRVQLDRA